jgi:cation diffusion facilitator family transporter
MHSHSIDRWTHEHLYLGAHHARNERRTRFVIALTAMMMIAEIAAGIAFGSMALLADGLHMATHAGALFISVAAYAYARRHAHDPRFSFGTGKVGDLAGFTSALILAVVALVIGYESLLRVFAPVPIRFDEAIAVAVLGLLVNLLSAWLLRDDDGVTGEHSHQDGHDHHHHHADHNLKAAYLHVLADTATSVLAIVALVMGRLYGWLWMDPLMGVVGALVIGRWSYRLMKDTAAVLVDVSADVRLEVAVRTRLETEGDRVADLHLWRVGPGHNAAALTIVTDRPRQPNHYKERLSDLPRISHITIEVQPCY